MVPRRHGARAGLDPLLRPGRAAGGEPPRGPGDREPVRLDDRDPARDRGPHRPSREHRDRGRRLGRGQGDRGVGNRSDEPGSVTMSDARIRAGEASGPTGARAGRGRPDHDAGARRRLPRDREGDGGRAVPDVLLVDHPRVRGSRRRDLRRAGPRALRVRLDADAHRLAAVVHPRVHAPPRGEDRRGRRDHPQPPVLRGLAQPGHRGRGADLPRRRALRVRRRDRARPRRRRLVPRDQRRRLRRVRRGEDLRRAPLVPGRGAERGSRQDDLRQRAHGHDEPRRHERDDGRLPARSRPDAAALPALRGGHRDERRLQLDGLLARTCCASRSARCPTASTRRRPAGSTTTRATAACDCASRRR